MMRKHTIPIQKEKGVALIEAMIAIVIFSVGILGIVALQANMVVHSSEAKYRAEAPYVAQQRISDVVLAPAANRPNLAEDVGVPTPIGPGTGISGLPNGTRATVLAGQSVTVIVTWQQPSGDVHNVTMVGGV